MPTGWRRRPPRRRFRPTTDEAAAKAFIYRHGAEAFADGALIDWARSGDSPDDTARATRVTLPERWSAPALPVRGADVVALGVPVGTGRRAHRCRISRNGGSAPAIPDDADRVRAKLEELARGELKARRDA